MRLAVSIQLICYTLFLTLGTISCSDTPTASGNQTFTPPTKMVFTVDDETFTSSADVVSCSTNGGFAELEKPFSAGRANLRILFSTSSSFQYRDINSQIEEGKYKVFYISTDHLTRSDDSVGIQLDQVPYYYKGISGRIYVSKLNGLLRYTSDGVLQLSGQKYDPSTGRLGGSYTKRLQFSVERGASN